MREIKFRVWDKEQKHWVHSNHIELRLDGKIYDPIRQCFPTEYELVQFTGLKDSNSIEIFEGDIVEAFDQRYQPWTYYKGVVEYDDGSFRINQHKFNYNGHSPLIEQSFVTKSGQIIGNIYENPELYKPYTSEEA